MKFRSTFLLYLYLYLYLFLLILRPRAEEEVEEDVLDSLGQRKNHREDAAPSQFTPHGNLAAVCAYD